MPRSASILLAIAAMACGLGSGPVDVSEAQSLPGLLGPVITVRSPADGQHVVLGAGIRTNFLCGGGLVIVTCRGSDVDTLSVGEKTFTVEAVDLFGNRSTKTVTFFVDPEPGPTAGDYVNAITKLFASGLVRPNSNGYYKVAFYAPGPGALRIRWAAGATIRASSGVTIATSDYVFGGRGTRTVKIVLNSRGRDRLHMARSRRLRVESTATFTPRGGRAHRRAKRITIARGSG